MADDLKNKPQKNSEISKDEKAVKADPLISPKVDHILQLKQRIKKNTSDLDVKKVKPLLQMLKKKNSTKKK